MNVLEMTAEEILAMTPEQYATLSNKDINYIEYVRNAMRDVAMKNKLQDSISKGDWSDFCGTLTICSRQVMEEFFIKYYSQVPDELKYSLVTDLYICVGDSIPAVRKALRGALKYGKPTLPPELEGMNEITVYRGGTENIGKATYRISWTLSREKAEWFADRNCLAGFPYHLYKGVISRDKIIAYTDRREEQEIMQYRNVRKIEELPFISEYDKNARKLAV